MGRQGLRWVVDAGCSILARQPVGLSHPFQVDDMVKRGQSCPRLRPRQFGYPLSFRGQVLGAQGLLPCFLATALIPWRPPSLARVPVSPVPRGQRYYEGATTSRLRIPGRLSVSLPGSARSSALRARLGGAPGWLETHPGQGIWSAGRPFAGALSRGRKRDLTGSQAIHPMPLLRSKTPAGPTIPHPDGVVDAAPARPTAKAPAIIISRLLTRLQHLLPTLHDGHRRTPCKARFRLVG